jgi:hypothetical protein
LQNALENPESTLFEFLDTLCPLRCEDKTLCELNDNKLQHALYSKHIKEAGSPFEELNYSVRYEKGSFQSGYCIVEKQANCRNKQIFRHGGTHQHAGRYPVQI